MNVFEEKIRVETKNKLEVLDITEEIKRVVSKSKVTHGLVVLWTPHTTAAVTINESDSDLWIDILETYKKLVPTSGSYRHNLKYQGIPSEQNAHAHILNSLIKPYLVIPLVNGKMTLGTWQSILFIELDGGRRREVVIYIYS